MKILNGENGLVLTEILVVVAILAVLAVIASPVFRFFQRETDLKNTAGEMVNVLKMAQNRTLSSEKASQWGVYFSQINNNYTLFKGESFSSRNPLLDEIKKIPGSIELYSVNLPDSEVVFERISGETSHQGNLSIRIKNSPAKTETVFIRPSGQVFYGTESTASDTDRIRDSRHVHFEYSRIITTTSENIILTFDQTIIQNISIADNLTDGQFFWEGEVEAGGQKQKIKIHSHRLNNPDSQFCVHRDRRYNSKSLKVEISGEAGADLITYQADGQVNKGTSLYVSDPAWQ